MGRCPKLLLVLSFAVALSSCMPYKKQVYWQFMNEVPEDSVKYFDPPKTVYRIQADDILDINITSEDKEIAGLFSKTYTVSQPNQMQQGGMIGGDPFYLTGYIVNDSGKIRLPVLGEIMVVEMTIDEIEEVITKELLKYFNPDKFYISVKLGGLRFSVFGEVGAPGRYVVMERNYNIYQALAEFGDMQTFAKRNDVYVLRKSSGKLKMAHVDLLTEDVFDSEYFYVMPNDIIYVRPVKIKNIGFGTTFLQNFGTTLSFISSTLLFVVTLRSLNN